MANNRRTRRIAKAMQRVAMPLASAQLRSVIERAHRRFDRDFAARIAAEGKPEEVSCRSGCAACCERAVLLTWAEADLLVARHPAVVAEVLPELERQNELLRELGAQPAAQPLQQRAEHDAHDALRVRWFAARVPCAFLDRASQRCRVYESRPLACRALAVTSPPEACAERPLETQPLSTPTPLAEGPEYRAAQLALMSATSDALGGTVVMGFLPGLVPRVVRDRGAGDQTVRV